MPFARGRGFTPIGTDLTETEDSEDSNNVGFAPDGETGICMEDDSGSVKFKVDSDIVRLLDSDLDLTPDSLNGPETDDASLLLLRILGAILFATSDGIYDRYDETFCTL